MRKGDGVDGELLVQPGGLLDDSERVVAAAVEDRDYLVAVGGHVVLAGERVQAGGDPGRLVAGRDDDDCVEVGVRRCELDGRRHPVEV